MSKPAGVIEWDARRYFAELGEWVPVLTNGDDYTHIPTMYLDGTPVYPQRIVGMRRRKPRTVTAWAVAIQHDKELPPKVALCFSETDACLHPYRIGPAVEVVCTIDEVAK